VSKKNGELFDFGPISAEEWEEIRLASGSFSTILLHVSVFGLRRIEILGPTEVPDLQVIPEANRRIQLLQQLLPILIGLKDRGINPALPEGNIPTDRLQSLVTSLRARAERAAAR